LSVLALWRRCLPDCYLAQPAVAQEQQKPSNEDAIDYGSEMRYGEKRPAADKGVVAAQMALARDHLEGKNGARKSVRSAARWLTKAAEQGEAEAELILANLLMKGSRELKAKPESALTLYASAADKGNVEAAYKAAHGYHYGTGVKPDLEKAVIYYTKAADAGNIEAKNNLGLMYLQGKGTTRDLSIAFRLFEDSAKVGNAWGQNNLGGMYEMGWGTAKDLDQALAYYEKSALAGNKHGKQNHERLKAVMAAAKANQTEAAENTGTGDDDASAEKAEKPADQVIQCGQRQRNSRIVFYRSRSICFHQLNRYRFSWWFRDSMTGLQTVRCMGRHMAITLR
jgi:TPR repeat protein